MQTTGRETDDQCRVIKREIKCLGVSKDREAAIPFGLGDASRGFHRSVLDRGGVPASFDNQVRLCKSLLNVTEPYPAAVMALVPEVVEPLASNDGRPRLYASSTSNTASRGSNSTFTLEAAMVAACGLSARIATIGSPQYTTRSSAKTGSSFGSMPINLRICNS